MALTQIKTAGIADDAVTSAKIPNDAIGSTELADDAITSALIADDAITSALIADDAVVTAAIADDAITQALIADDAVGLAQMASGTDGQIITYDASGNPTAVGPGTDGQVLTSTGAGSPPAFETLTTSGEAFQARMTTSGSYSANDIIIYNSDADSWNTYDVGNNYDSSTGKYTAPVDGVYYFEAQAMTTGWSNNDSTQDGLQLKSNHGMISYPRQRRSTFRSEDDAHGYYTNSIAGTAKLSAGDTVWIVTSHACGVSNTQYSYFTGWLIA